MYVATLRLIASFVLLYSNVVSAQPAAKANAPKAIVAEVISLVHLASLGDIPGVEKLLASGMNINAAEAYHSMGALHTAVANGQIRLVNKLLMMGANPNAVDQRGVTPLILAVHYSNGEVVKLLLQANANTNTVPHSGPTALITAIQKQDLGLVVSLLEAGASSSLPDCFGTTPIKAAQRTQQASIVTRINAALEKMRPPTTP